MRSCLLFIFRCFGIFALISLILPFAGVARSALAQGDIRPIPPPGVAISESDRAELTAGVGALNREIESLRTELARKKSPLLRYLPDVQIYFNALRFPLLYNEFYDVKQVATARELLRQGIERAKALRLGDAPWTKQAGLLALGYISKIDGSVQPYGLVVPTTWTAGDTKPRRLDFFCHGRGETLTELAFINDRQKNAGEFTPPDTFVLHPYGRYCNANRFAGEVDLFEALADAKKRYPIDEDRLIVRGFSMGGASCWQYATHHSDLWAAAAPGAGFSETVGFLNLLGSDKTPPPWYETKLMHWYDSTDYAVNLAQCPTVAYNGDKDGQKQAADMMEAAMTKENLPLTRVTGLNTGHWYQADSKKDIDARLQVFAAKGREKLPAQIRFTTWTLRYPTMNWITVTGLGQHWERARVDAERTADGITLTTENVTRFSLSPTVADAARKSVTVDGQKLSGIQFVKNKEGKWMPDRTGDNRLRKKPGIQGPIDDAFLERFVMVRPSGKPLDPRAGAWADSEMIRAVHEWRATFRGDAIVKGDNEITDAEIKGGNLILWGDPSSNAILARIAPRLPIRWEKDGTVTAAGKTYPAGTSVPVFIYPNPLNPNRYIVVNSGITWRESAYLNNAQQRSRLPDWAIIDITVTPDKNAPGRIAAADFFDENWQFKN